MVVFKQIYKLQHKVQPLTPEERRARAHRRNRNANRGRDAGEPLGEPGEEDVRNVEDLLIHINGPADLPPMADIPQQNDPVLPAASTQSSSSDDDLTPPGSGYAYGSRFRLLSETLPLPDTNPSMLSTGLQTQPKASSSMPSASTTSVRSVREGRKSDGVSTRGEYSQHTRDTFPGTVRSSTSIRSVGSAAFPKPNNAASQAGRGSEFAGQRIGIASPKPNNAASGSYPTASRPFRAASRPLLDVSPHVLQRSYTPRVPVPGKSFTGYNWIRGSSPQAISVVSSQDSMLSSTTTVSMPAAQLPRFPPPPSRRPGKIPHLSAPAVPPGFEHHPRVRTVGPLWFSAPRPMLPPPPPPAIPREFEHHPQVRTVGPPQFSAPSPIGHPP